MKEKLQLGQRFRFLKDTDAIGHYHLGKFQGFEAPIARARKMLDSKGLTGKLEISTEVVFIAVEVQTAATAPDRWCVTARREDEIYEINFFQLVNDTDPPQDFLEVEIISSPIYNLAKACEEEIGKNEFVELIRMTNFEDALGFAFTILIECGIEDPEQFLKEKGILE